MTPGRVQAHLAGARGSARLPRGACRPSWTADWVVFGPGSWFTSVLPHLKVPELAEALLATKAQRLVALNLAPQPGETDDFSPQQHLEVLRQHAPDLQIDVVLADPAWSTNPRRSRRRSHALGGRLVMADVAAADGSPRHDPARLAQAFVQIFSEALILSRRDWRQRFRRL